MRLSWKLIKLKVKGLKLKVTRIVRPIRWGVKFDIILTFLFRSS